MSDLSAYGSSIQGLKEQAQSCRVRVPPLLSSYLVVSGLSADFNPTVG